MFDGDETYLNKVSTRWDSKLRYVFENSEGDVVHFSLPMNFVFVDEIQHRKDLKRAFMFGHDLCKEKPYPLYADEFDKWYESNFLKEEKTPD